MGENTEIGWTDHTWNPWVGCKKVSSGCVNCYMFRDVVRFGHDPEIVRRTSAKTFNRPFLWDEKHKDEKIFVCSWSDFFIAEADEFRNDAWEIIKQCKNLKFQILTKRPERIVHFLPSGGIPDNVAIGITVENMHASGRLRYLKEVECSMKFISIEPMLEPIDIKKLVKEYGFRPDWIICGGESGPKNRQMRVEWARQLKLDCASLGISFFMKQMSGFTKQSREDIPEVLRSREFPEGWE